MSDAGSAACYHEQLVAPEPEAVSQARRFAAAAVVDLGGDVDAEATVVMLVSELVTNVVLHARTDALVRIGEQAEVLRVSVVDGNPLRARRVRSRGRGQGSGRGLRLLEGLSAEHGHHPDGSIAPLGKCVWFTVPKRTSPEHERSRLAATEALFDGPDWW